MLAQKAGLFVVTLVGDVELGSVDTFFDPDAMDSVIKRLGLTECVFPHIHVLPVLTKLHREMNWVLGVLNKFQNPFISQKDIARIEAKLIQALEILQVSSQQITTAQRTFAF